MKKQILNLFLFIWLSLNAFGQSPVDTTDIYKLPIQGKFEYIYKDQIFNDYQIMDILRKSNEFEIQKYLKKNRRRDIMAQVTGGIGAGFAGIWLINELFNSDFHSPDPMDVKWKQVVVGTTLTFSITGILLNRSAKKQIIFGIEEFNK
jgi:hypothetical protein